MGAIAVYATGYVGCYKDVYGHWDLSAVQHEMGINITPQLCVEYCGDQGYAYAGVQGGHCSCDNSYGFYGPGQCSFPCMGDNAFICGGVGDAASNSVYMT